MGFCPVCQFYVVKVWVFVQTVIFYQLNDKKMSGNLELSVYNYVSEVYGNDLTNDLTERLGARMKDPDFQERRARMLETLPQKITPSVLVYAYRLFRNNLFDIFFESIGGHNSVDLSSIDMEKRRVAT